MPFRRLDPCPVCPTPLRCISDSVCRREKLEEETRLLRLRVKSKDSLFQPCAACTSAIDCKGAAQCARLALLPMLPPVQARRVSDEAADRLAPPVGTPPPVPFFRVPDNLPPGRYVAVFDLAQDGSLIIRRIELE